MAFGFTPKFKQDLDLNGLDPRHYLAIALDAAKHLGWEINYTSKSGFIAYTSTSIFSNNQKFTVILRDDKVDINSENAGSGMYDWGRNKDNVENFISEFNTIQAKLSSEQLEEKIKELSPVFNSLEQDTLALPPPTTGQQIQDFFLLFVPKEGFFITPIIIDINILIFIFMVFSGVSVFLPETHDLLKWGGNFRALVLTGEQWRLFTNIFIHAGILHLLLNMYALLYIGVLLEPYLGKARFLLSYLTTGIIASLASIYWHPITVSVGASGAIFGMYGVFLSMLTTNLIEKKARKPLLASIAVFVVLNLMNGVKEGIDNAAHVGGLISGSALGYIYYPSLKNPLQAKWTYGTMLVVFISFITSCFVIYRQIPDDIVKYDSLLKKISKLEEDALSVFGSPGNTPKAVLLEKIEVGKNDWNKNISILNEIDSLDVPAELIIRNYNLRKYCKLRIKSYDFIEKAIDDESNVAYKDSIASYKTQIEALLNEIKSK